MLHFLDFLLVGVFLFIAYQDFRFRAISIWTLPLLITLVIFINLDIINSRVFIINSLVNILVFAFQLFLVTIYFSVRNRRITNIVNHYLGLGDILFVFVMGFMFSPVLFMFFLVIGLIVVGLVYAVCKLLISQASSTIPLAGGMSLILSFFWTGKIIFNIEQVYSIPVIEHLIIR